MLSIGRASELEFECKSEEICQEAGTAENSVPTDNRG